MNATVAIDTLAYANKLKAAGIPVAQAEAQAEALADILFQQEGRLATKQDLTEMENRFDHKIDSVELKLEAKIEAFSYKMTIRLGSMLAASVFIVASLHKIL